MTVRRWTPHYDSWGRYCGARKRQPTHPGETCRRPAGWGTWHPGCGRCKLHGGARGYTRGRYSTVARETLYTILRARIFDDERLGEVLGIVFEEAGLAEYLADDEDEP
jgi:hypothetical protein